MVYPRLMNAAGSKLHSNIIRRLTHPWGTTMEDMMTSDVCCRCWQIVFPLYIRSVKDTSPQRQLCRHSRTRGPLYIIPVTQSAKASCIFSCSALHRFELGIGYGFLSLNQKLAKFGIQHLWKTLLGCFPKAKKKLRVPNYYAELRIETQQLQSSRFEILITCCGIRMDLGTALCHALYTWDSKPFLLLIMKI